MASGRARSKCSFGRWGVRFMALGGCFLIALASFGWWLDTRVFDDDGFADVVAKASQKQEVRDYIADQATLRLARSSNFVSAAPAGRHRRGRHRDRHAPGRGRDPRLRGPGPPPGLPGPRRAAGRHRRAAGLHHDPLRAADDQPVALEEAARERARRVGVGLAELRRRHAVHRSASGSGSGSPIGILGIALLGFALVRSPRPGPGDPHGRDDAGGHRRAARRVRRRVPGARGGRGERRPAAAATRSPRSSRCSPVGSSAPGSRSSSSAWRSRSRPGQDGGDLRDRAYRVPRAGSSASGLSRRWRFAGGLGVVVLAALVLTQPGEVAHRLVDLAALARPLPRRDRLPARRRASSSPTTRSRGCTSARSSACSASMVVGFLVTATVAVCARRREHDEPDANPDQNGCNGYIELCLQPIDQVVWPAATTRCRRARTTSSAPSTRSRSPSSSTRARAS